MKPKTLFANFDQEAVKKIAGIDELDYEFGFIDPCSWKHYYPSPAHDYQIVVVNLDSAAVEKEVGRFPDVQSEPTDAHLLLKHLDKGFVLAFVGDANRDYLINAGINNINLIDADKRDRVFEKPGQSDSVFDFIFDKNEILFPVQKYIESTFANDFHYAALKFNKNIDVIASYRTRDFYTDIEGVTHRYRRATLLLLPQFADNFRVIADVLKVLFSERPDLFTNLSTQNWQNEPQFLPPEIEKIESEIATERNKFDKFLQKKEIEKNKAIKNHSHFIQILKADDQHFAGQNKLSVNVMKVLKFLGFGVEDVDEKIKSAIKREDYWVVDGDYFALGEVTGTESSNPKVKEFNDMLARILNVVKKGLPERYKDKDIKGLLIINNDRKNHPLKRTKLYTGDLEDTCETAAANGISILSTVELYKIATEVLLGRMSKDDARQLIKSGGRIELPKKVSRQKV